MEIRENGQMVRERKEGLGTSTITDVESVIKDQQQGKVLPRSLVTETFSES